MGVVENRPMRTPGVANAAASAAIARSQVAINWHPAAGGYRSYRGDHRLVVWIGSWESSPSHIKSPPVVIAVLADHLAQVVTRREALACRGQNVGGARAHAEAGGTAPPWPRPTRSNSQVRIACCGTYFRQGGKWPHE